MQRSARLLLFLCATSPALLGAQCVEYDPRFAATAPATPEHDGNMTAPASDAEAPTITDDGAAPPAPPPGATFTPGKACAATSTAIIKVQNRQFVIDCGCAQTTGKTCTIPLGATVRWQFVDSTEHNVSGTMVGPSGEKLIGDFQAVFTKTGTFKYGCSIHRDMRDYSVVVE
jgi:plastocyanin